MVELVDGSASVLAPVAELPQQLRQDIINGAGVNNSAVLSNGNIIGGNSTDRALLGFLAANGCGGDIVRDNVTEFSAFDSNKKSSSVTVAADSGMVTYLKGAPEKIIDSKTTSTSSLP